MYKHTCISGKVCITTKAKLTIFWRIKFLVHNEFANRIWCCINIYQPLSDQMTHCIFLCNNCRPSNDNTSFPLKNHSNSYAQSWTSGNQYPCTSGIFHFNYGILCSRVWRFLPQVILNMMKTPPHLLTIQQKIIMEKLTHSCIQLKVKKKNEKTTKETVF